MPPGAAKPANSEPIIHVMPAEFRGGKTPMTQPKPPALPPKPVAPSPPPPAPVPPAPKPAATPAPAGKAPVKKAATVSPILVIAGLVFLLLVIGGGAYILLTIPGAPATNTNTTVVVNTPPVNTPPVNTPPVNTTPVVVTPQPGKDSDSDGLTDVEEVLYGSDPHNPDTDGDSYLDGNEVFHMYNPNGNAPSNLADAGFVRPFSQSGFGYTLYYPSQWTIQLIGGVTEQVQFRSATGESISVQKTIKSSEPANGLPITTRQGYTGVASADKMTTYLESGSDVFAIAYSLGSSTQINYLTTYQMMVNTFKVVTPTP